MSKLYNIWKEGHRATGSSDIAQLLKENIRGNSFREVCIEFAKTEEADELGGFDESDLSFWGCSLFDNEVDARKFCG